MILIIHPMVQPEKIKRLISALRISWNKIFSKLTKQLVEPADKIFCYKKK